MERVPQEDPDDVPFGSSADFTILPMEDAEKKSPQYMASMPVKRLVHPLEKSMGYSVLVTAVFVISAFITGIPIMATLLAILPIAAFVRYACHSCLFSSGCLHYQTCNDFVSATDAFWLHEINFDSSIAHCLFFLERGLQTERLRDMIMMRVITVTNEEGLRAFPRFMQKFVTVSTGYCWIDDEDFAVENHVYDDNKRIRTKRNLVDYVSKVTNEPLSKNRPLWEIRVIQNYGLHRETVLLVRTHHALSDGVSFVKMLANYLADNPQMLRLKPRIGGATFPMNVFRALVVGPLTFLSWLFCARRDYNLLSHRQPMAGRRVVAWSDDICYTKVNRIKKVIRCSLNDVFLSAIRGSVREYFQKCGIPSPPNITVNMSMDLRYEPTSMESVPQMGTNYAIVNVRLPTNTEGAIPGLWDVREVMDEVKSSSDPVVMYGAVHLLLTILPESLSHWLLRTVIRKASLSFCNLAGPELPVYLDSHRLKRITFWMTSSPRVPLSFCVISYCGAFYVSVSADTSSVSRPKVLVQGIIAQIDRLTSLLAKRRIPGENRRRSSFTAERRREEILKPPAQEIQKKLHAVQEEMYEIRKKLESASFLGQPPLLPEFREFSAYQEMLTLRAEELKEEFTELINELQRRKSIIEGIAAQAEGEESEWEPRRHRRGRRSSLSSFPIFRSTARPLTTPLFYMPPSPDMQCSSYVSLETRRAVLTRLNQVQSSQMPLIGYSNGENGNGTNSPQLS